MLFVLISIALFVIVGLAIVDFYLHTKYMWLLAKKSEEDRDKCEDGEVDTNNNVEYIYDMPESKKRRLEYDLRLEIMNYVTPMDSMNRKVVEVLNGYDYYYSNYQLKNSIILFTRVIPQIIRSNKEKGKYSSLGIHANVYEGKLDNKLEYLTKDELLVGLARLCLDFFIDIQKRDVYLDTYAVYEFKFDTYTFNNYSNQQLDSTVVLSFTIDKLMSIDWDTVFEKELLELADVVRDD